MLRVAKRARVGLLAFSGVFPLLAGCHVHPIPDDISPLSTEEIVLNMRCEVKSAVRDQIREQLVDLGLPHMVPDDVLKPANLAQIRAAHPVNGPRMVAMFKLFSKLTMAYAFDFDIIERNASAATGTFTWPFSKGTLTTSAGGGLEKIRNGKRVFTAVETFGELADLKCGNAPRRGPDILYPITGSIGMTRVVNTFIQLTLQGGAGGTAAGIAGSPAHLFTDTLTFTTEWKGGARAQLEIAPVKGAFRLTKLDAEISSGRKDVHKVIIAFTFPDTKELREASGMGRINADAATIEDSKRMAIENLCIARAKDREDEAGTLRLYPPEIYCRRQPIAPAVRRLPGT